MTTRRNVFLRPDLSPEETILWEGAPAFTTAKRPHERPQYLVGGGFIVAGIAMLPNYWPPVWFAVFVACIGLYSIGGWRYWDAFVRSRTWYTLTNRRACIGKDFGLYIPVRSYSAVEWTERRILPEGRLSTVVFRVNPLNWNYRFPLFLLRGPMDNRLGFELLENGDQVLKSMWAIKSGELP